MFHIICKHIEQEHLGIHDFSHSQKNMPLGWFWSRILVKNKQTNKNPVWLNSISLIYVFNIYLLNSYYVPGTMQGTGSILLKNTKVIPIEASNMIRETNKQLNREKNIITNCENSHRGN